MKSKKIRISRSSRRVRVGITMGDPSGIGSEIIVRSLASLGPIADVTIIGDAFVFSKVTSCVRRKLACAFIDLHNVRRMDFSFGTIKAEYGKASVDYLDKAMDLLKDKQLDCLVTAPISKEALSLAGIPLTGHTEYLARAASAKRVVMMLLNKFLKISLVTRHLPLQQVSRSIHKRLIRETLLLTRNALTSLFLIRKPRIVICGLNPHASDNGVLGPQEHSVIMPALKGMGGKKGIVDGPLSADVALYKLLRKEYDAAVAMYHDQALIALKLLDASTGVNITLGLPFVRTSPLHGTAFDIAGKHCANALSMQAAIQTAIQCCANLKNA
ncbi:MAG: 4-hydroxythreonine-4-phosphate dehydrogenase PdxA [Candidatus Omnitrophica bacterium]|nr:4-hydroxythreonine-4-phosphate dehydrogenase PdxA [Candidatus Omnitrophota bacterium]